MIVVTGASGRLGRLVAHALAEHVSPSEVRLGTRYPGKIADLSAQGFTTAAFDFDDPASMQSTFAGAEVALIISGDVWIRPDRPAIDAARASGVARLAYTSFTNPTPDSLFPFAAMYAGTEACLKSSGLPYTILRNNQYAGNIDGALAAAKATGTLALPGPEGKVAFITHADVAAAAAGALTGNGHAGKIYEVTGPEALNLFDIAEILSKAWGRTIKAGDMELAEYGRVLAAHGVPPGAAEADVRLREAVAAGEYAAVSNDAERLAGRPIEPMSSYVARY